MSADLAGTSTTREPAPRSLLEERVLEAVDGVIDEAVDLTRALVRIPTVNPPGDEYTTCADFIARNLESLGYEAAVLPAEGMPEHSLRYPRQNVLGALSGAGGGPTLHFNGHLDVVPPGSGWTVDPFGGDLRDGRVYGRGTCDQKAGVAASIYAVEAIRRAGVQLAGTVEQSATADEESGGFAGVAWLCDRGYIRQGRQDFVVITEPLDPERVCIGHRGVLWLEVTTLGTVGHGSMPGLAVNAVDLMVRFLHALDADLRPRLAQRVTAQPVEPAGARMPTVSVNAVHAGQSLGGWQSPCVPDRCTVVLDRRWIAEEHADGVRAEVIALLDDLAASDPQFQYEVRDLMLVEPLVGDARSRVAKETAGAIRHALGVSEVPFIHSPGTYDQKHVLRRAGIAECIAYGPGRLVLAHQPDEFVAVEDLAASMRVMALLALRLLGTAG